MRHLAVFLLLLCFVIDAHAGCDGLAYDIDDTPTCVLNVNDSTGAVDADSVPAYRVYEEITDTAILTGTMAKLDDTNTTGLYRVQLTLSAANGFESGKSYTVQECATVSSVETCVNDGFKIRVPVTVATNNDKTGYSISGTKTTLDALNDLDAAGIRSALGLSTANLDTQLSGIPAAVLDLSISSHRTAGTVGGQLSKIH